MTLIEKIDAVFKWLYLNSGNNPSFADIENGLKDKEIEKGEIRDILLKLKDDNLIYCVYETDHNAAYTDWSNYLVNFNGKYFYEAVGSFAEKIRRENQAIIDAADQNRRMERNEVLLTGWTRRLTYATLVAAGLIVFWDMVKTFLLSACH